MTLALGATLVGLGLLGAFVAGLLGVGGAVVMIPFLLYGPPLLGVGRLDVKTVAGVTMAQVFVAALSGMIAHWRHRAVNTELVWNGGLSMALGSLLGALASKFVADRILLLVFALMATAAVILMFMPMEAVDDRARDEPARFSRTRTAMVAGFVGIAAGLVGAGGAFLLVPLLLVVVRVPIRVTIGSSLAIVALSSTAGIVGKLITDQIALAPAVAVALGAVPGAQFGAAVSRRVAGPHLKIALGVVVFASALRVWWDLLAR